MSINYSKVEPIIVYPLCMKNGGKQDCFSCNLLKENKCESPRGFCAKQYMNHRKGCPKYDNCKTCPPNIPMFDQVFRLDQPIYVIYSVYDLKSHADKMRSRHPHWTERQVYNVLYWQGSARKVLKSYIADFKKEFGDLGYFVTTSPEAMGVDVTNSIKSVIPLEWPARNKAVQVAFAGVPVDESYHELLY